MQTLLCPNCRERLSSVERGLGGISSCLYCEGTWLNAEQLRRLLALRPEAKPVFTGPSVDERALVCASCVEAELAALSTGDLTGWTCRRCKGGFFGKGVVLACAPEMASRAEQAPVIEALLAVMAAPVLLADPLLLAASQPPKR